MSIPVPAAAGQVAPTDADPHARWMTRAFELAERARGRTSPNPFVGCVIVRDGGVVGEGWTQPPGGSHAEVVALGHAGDAARGSTVYVTLEPCAHTGRTPPCTQALIAAGVTRVVAALADPNPVATGGAARLRAAGISVDLDVAVQRARRQHEVFLHGLVHHRPFVVAKVASSLDGHIADHTGRSQWITGPEARRRSHALRAEADAVMVGSGTALADDPRLTVRLDGYDGPQPTRVVLDRRGRTRGEDLTMLHDDAAATLVLDAPTPALALDRLAEEGISSVLLEGGAALLGAFVSADLVDRYEVHLAGLLLGSGLPGVAGAFDLANAPRLELASAVLCGDDVLVTAYPRRADDTLRSQ
ncbi:MAG TPA: bifunctional diaminohydroxyphosphoribosylaminopyrimidine deaminase/5-amino-6-(5-phosphoribosylamino)uracil reductase RibD [Euzebya sp.]|nr:bifunctional diaminohydroxyphosphoribosylaminopyrimidine deaminase/5-amino-6-(5-phosphoribosylamino)uracil reductase RibD [Euzebya sp.]